jgi:hypothetical protein
MRTHAALITVLYFLGLVPFLLGIADQDNVASDLFAIYYLINGLLVFMFLGRTL